MVQVLFRNEDQMLTYRVRINGTIESFDATYIAQNVQIDGQTYTVQDIIPTRYRTIVNVESPTNPVTQVIFDLTPHTYEGDFWLVTVL